jgi:hypothetical protein
MAAALDANLDPSSSSSSGKTKNKTNDAPFKYSAWGAYGVSKVEGGKV